jgi:hypothetical protein
MEGERSDAQPDTGQAVKDAELRVGCLTVRNKTFDVDAMGRSCGAGSAISRRKDTQEKARVSTVNAEMKNNCKQEVRVTR